MITIGNDSHPSVEKEQKITKTPQIKKFFENLYSWEFFFEFLMLAVHPLPMVERAYVF